LRPPGSPPARTATTLPTWKRCGRPGGRRSWRPEGPAREASAEGAVRQGPGASKQEWNMAWVRKGRKDYYYRSKKVNGRVTRLYFGNGKEARLAALLDGQQRAERQARTRAVQADRARVQPLAALIEELDDLAVWMAQAALVSAGFYQHDRGEWRYRRHG